MNEIMKGGKKSEDQNSTMNNNKTLYEPREKVINLFDYCYRIVPEAKYKQYGEGLRMLTPKLNQFNKVIKQNGYYNYEF